MIHYDTYALAGAQQSSMASLVDQSTLVHVALKMETAKENMETSRKNVLRLPWDSKSLEEHHLQVTFWMYHMQAQTQRVQ